MMNKCKQLKCVFNHVAGCPECNECHSEPNIVEENCVSCHNCMYDEGFIRGKPFQKKLIIIQNAIRE